MARKRAGHELPMPGGHEKGGLMYRRQRWFDASVVLALEMTVPLVVTAGDRVEPRVPGDRDRCSVCGMFVAPHPEWIAQIVYDDGTVAFFDGAKDLFRYMVESTPRTPNPGGREISRIFVTGYYDRKPIDAVTASFVVGSDVLGPMGAELIPHASPEEAREFSRDHGGSEIVGFDQVTPGLLANLD